MLMAYVEWLRVCRTLKWTAITLGVLLGLAVVLRVIVLDVWHHSVAPHEMKVAYFVPVASALAIIVATILGAPFARENDGHLEVAFTKPVDRTSLALEIMGFDAGGVAVAYALGLIFAVVGHTVFVPPYVTFGYFDAVALVAGLLVALAWYAMLAAATASLRRGYGGVLAVAWPLATIVAVIGLLPAGNNAMLAVVHDLFRTLSYIDPLAYVRFGAIDKMDHSLVLEAGWQSRLTMLGLLAVGYGALAIGQWRRVEA